jgi:ribosomal protein S18 acetylase RimI-like enzyme|tara:strand:+ start:60 stop:194 length:135 start_codon:yes stop_codon:yes gene_type:complete
MGTAKSLLNSIGNGKTVRAWLVANDNTSASGFYKKNGFQEVSCP